MRSQLPRCTALGRTARGERRRTRGAYMCNVVAIESPMRAAMLTGSALAANSRPT